MDFIYYVIIAYFLFIVCLYAKSQIFSREIKDLDKRLDKHQTENQLGWGTITQELNKKAENYQLEGEKWLRLRNDELLEKRIREIEMYLNTKNKDFKDFIA